MKFLFYFSIRRILHELNAPLHGDDGFKNNNNAYSDTFNKRLCAEFGISKEGDFCYREGKNHGLGIVWTVNGKLPRALYPEDAYRFTDKTYHGEKVVEGCDGNITFCQRERPFTFRQWDAFALPQGSDLTKAGLVWLNHSIETYVYCVLTAQSLTRTSIRGESGDAFETQDTFKNLLEAAIQQPVGPAKFREAVFAANCRLDVAISPGPGYFNHEWADQFLERWVNSGVEVSFFVQQRVGFSFPPF